ncbi:uncharacterized protein LOC120840460 [Ixodes scapularis]|uniref:uncharacterized protein LOC120840460 n=1 Tax=Ixodes scapularis TaxID=6945 RepID=UPI001A9D59FE|nr:uncharacterized protein LOC120840460 [Ixodes scapularis]
MLANVIFYLRDTARTWFETHEEELTSWDLCKAKLQDLFGRPTGRKLSAKRKLASRVQTSTESYVTYIQDVLSLCRKANPEMPEIERMEHILKGIADDAFQLLVIKDCSTVDDVLKECRRFEAAKTRRIAHKFNRLPNTPATSSCEDPDTNTERITKIVRREPEAMMPADVLITCPHEIILGWDFLSSHSALIDCAKGEIELDTSNLHYHTASQLSKVVPQIYG